MPAAKDTRGLVVPPAVAMLVCALGMLTFNLFVLVFGDSDQSMAGTADAIEELFDEAGWKDFELHVETLSGFHYAFLAAMFLATSVAALGATLMLMQRSWWLSLVAALLMFTPFLWLCCCPLPAAVGVWALVILARPDVRAAFGRGPAQTPAAFTVPPPPTGSGPETPSDQGDQDDPGGQGGGWGSGS